MRLLKKQALALARRPSNPVLGLPKEKYDSPCMMSKRERVKSKRLFRFPLHIPRNATAGIF